MFAAHTALTAREAFLSLAEQLEGFFRGSVGVATTVAMGLDPADDRTAKLLSRVSRWPGSKVRRVSRS